MPSKYLEVDERIIRYVPWAKLRKDEDDTVLGPLYTAFELRTGEEYLSVTWCEYFSGNPEETLRCAAIAIRNSNFAVKTKGCFAVASVGDVLDFIEVESTDGIKLRIIHEPEDDNNAHVAVRRWPKEDMELLDRIAEDVWSETWTKTQIDEAAKSDCIVSERGAA